MKPERVRLEIAAVVERRAEIEHSNYVGTLLVFGGLSYPLNHELLIAATEYLRECTEARQVAADEWIAA